MLFTIGCSWPIVPLLVLLLVLVQLLQVPASSWCWATRSEDTCRCCCLAGIALAATCL